ncbi:MAG: CHAT domain-containing protein [Planctomycetes bacterium]|nr:CHAT domain-containing protein [Planctomycetota bacterium]
MVPLAAWLLFALFCQTPAAGPQTTVTRGLRIAAQVPGEGAAVEVDLPEALAWQVWVEASFDTRLVVESLAGEVLAEDDDSGGRPVPCVRILSASGPRVRLRALSKAALSAGELQFRVVPLPPPSAEEELACREARILLEELERGGSAAATRGRIQAAVAGFGGSIASELAALTLERLAGVAQQHGFLEAGAPALRLVLDWREATLPESHADVQQCRIDLAVVLARTDALEAASALAEPALAVLEATRDPDDVVLQNARDQVAVMRKVRGDLEGARVLGELALESLSRTLPDGHELLLRVRSNAAVTRAMLGDLNGAQDLFRESVRILSATRGEDDAQLQVARMNLANALSGLGDHVAAREIEEAVLRAREARLPGHHPEVARSRTNLARTLRELGDYEGARLQLERLLADQQAGLPAGHPAITSTRESLSLILRVQGDLAAARRIGEEVLEEELARRSPDDVDLQVMRLNLAVSCMRMGEPARALELIEPAFEVLARKLPPQHPLRHGALVSLGNAKYELGELVEARALREEALDIAVRFLPEGHAEALRARHNLAISLAVLGETDRALALAREAVAGALATRPEDDVDVRTYSAGLATLLQEVGDLQGARAIRERQLEIATSTRPADHPDVAAARLEAAASLQAAGDLESARELIALALESRERTRPAGHPDVFEARVSLAGNRLRAGDARTARAQLEAALAAPETQLAADHPYRETAEALLAQALRGEEQHAAARALEQRVLEQRRARLAPGHPALVRALLAVARGEVLEEVARRRTPEVALPDPEAAARFAAASRDFVRAGVVATQDLWGAASPREVMERGARSAAQIGAAFELAAGAGVFAPDAEASELAFAFSEAVRSAAVTSARRLRASGRDPRDDELRLLVRRASRELADLAAAGAPQSELDRVRGGRERAETALLARAAAREARGEAAPPLGLPSLGELSRALGQDGAIAAFRIHRAARFAEAESSGETRLHVHVLCGLGQLHSIDLGLAEPIGALVAAWAAGVAASLVPARGLAQPAAPDAEPDPDLLGARLRDVVLARVLAAAPQARKLVLLLDGPLHRVAWDALPLARDESGATERVGDRFEVEVATSLAAWLTPGQRPAGADRLVAVGAVDYAVEAWAPGTAAVSAPGGDARGALVTRAFAPLPGTRVEVEGIASLHARRGSGPTLVLAGREATSERFLLEAESARWLHVATHGWFAPELFGTERESVALDLHSGLGARLDRSASIRERSPLLLCGLAFAGANRSVGVPGQRHGLVTADEIAALDLRGVELAVLSACETHLGVEGEGQGVASLQQALLMAGANSVVTSLFEVPDEATSELMQAFYTRLWEHGASPARALWDAKLALRWPHGRGVGIEASLVDWAGWVLTGNPR